jgi:hypothetical protein
LRDKFPVTWIQVVDIARPRFVTDQFQVKVDIQERKPVQPVGVDTAFEPILAGLQYPVPLRAPPAIHPSPPRRPPVIGKFEMHHELARGHYEPRASVLSDSPHKETVAEDQVNGSVINRASTAAYDFDEGTLAEKAFEACRCDGMANGVHERCQIVEVGAVALAIKAMKLVGSQEAELDRQLALGWEFGAIQ